MRWAVDAFRVLLGPGDVGLARGKKQEIRLERIAKGEKEATNPELPRLKLLRGANVRDGQIWRSAHSSNIAQFARFRTAQSELLANV